MTRNARPITVAQYALTRDERAQIFDRFGLSISAAAKAFGVGDETKIAVAAFGAQRVLWASDATHDEAGTGWPDSLAFVRQHPGLSETDKAWVLGGTARRLYRWPATPD